MQRAVAKETPPTVRGAAVDGGSTASGNARKAPPVRYKVVRTGATYTDGPRNSDEMVQEMGLMSQWRRRKTPVKGLTGIILETRPHPINGDKEIVAAFEADDGSGDVFMIDQSALERI